MSTQHEHEFEAAPGLPEKLPAGERILWQGAPEWRGLGVAAFGLRTIAMYLFVMWLLQFAHLWDQGSSALEMAKYLGISGVCATLAWALLAGFTYLVSSTTLYTLTNRRVVMRSPGPDPEPTLPANHRRLAQATGARNRRPGGSDQAGQPYRLPAPVAARPPLALQSAPAHAAQHRRCRGCQRNSAASLASGKPQRTHAGRRSGLCTGYGTQPRPDGLNPGTPP